MVTGIMLFLMDMHMIYRFFVSLNRIILLTAENKWTIIYQHLILLAVITIFIIRDINEDLLRTGSQIIFFVTGYYYDIFIMEEKYPNGYWLFHNYPFRVIHNVFPLISGLIIIRFKILSTGSLFVGNDHPDMEEYCDILLQKSSAKDEINDTSPMSQMSSL
jgi:hypothetical protein